MIKKMISTLVLTSILGIAGCGQTVNSKESDIGKTMINLKNMQDWCVGRYTFKLPKEAKMIDESINYDTFKIESKIKATKADFEQEVKAIEKKYSTKDDFIKEQTPLETYGSITSKIIWGHSTFANGKLPVDVYAFVYDQSTKTFFRITGSYSKKNENKSINGIKYLVKNLKGRNSTEIPVEQGICLKNGFIKDDGKNYKFTRQKVGFNFANAPSVVIVAETEAIYKVEDDLITRTENNLKKSPNYVTTKNQTQDIRKGTKSANPSSPIHGLELVTQVPMQGGTGIIATWEHAGTVNTALDPLLSMTVDTARETAYVQTASVHNQNGLEIYEAVLNSIRKF
ncbi:MAG: T6SS immunity protein Tli4 family protein [Acinetobacter sp.]